MVLAGRDLSFGAVRYRQVIDLLNRGGGRHRSDGQTRNMVSCGRKYAGERWMLDDISVIGKVRRLIALPNK